MTMYKKGSMLYLAYDDDGVLIDMDDCQQRLAERIGITSSAISHAICRGSKYFARVREADLYGES